MFEITSVIVDEQNLVNKIKVNFETISGDIFEKSFDFPFSMTKQGITNFLENFYALNYSVIDAYTENKKEILTLKGFKGGASNG